MTLKVCPDLQDRLKEYDSILLHGYSFFKHPSASSKKAVETESSLAIDKKKIPIAPELRGLALELSGYLVTICIDTQTTKCCMTLAGEATSGRMCRMMEGLL